MQIPMVDLREQFLQLQDEIEYGFRDVFDSMQCILGPNVTALEKEIAAFCGRRHAIGVASGTDALHLALLAAGIKAGDEVITSPFSFIATAEAICYTGARPVFVDIDPQTFNLDPDLVEAAVTDRTRAVVPVHLFGQPAALGPLLDICRRHGLRMVEDCAQSFGAEYRGKKTGAWGDAGCFSFFPSKNLGCYGDGGMIVTDDDALAASVRMLHNHGSRERYHHSVIGFNSRLDEVQAVVLRAKLKRVEQYNAARRRHAAYYTERLQQEGVRTPVEKTEGRHVYHQYTILCDRRGDLARALADQGIASAVYYPVPLHRQEALREYCGSQSLPIAELCADRVLSLPMYPELKEEQLERVCQAVCRFIRGASAEAAINAGKSFCREE
ncbi:MAG: DegT/DnrJ/EryC1/StrS family aminotransferase [Syntrophotaleaceae bacterium]